MFHDSCFLIAGNIPYYITGRLLRILGELEPKPRRVVLTIQKEVAERVTAKPPHMNRLAGSVQFWAMPSIVSVISKNAFHPPPKVDSATLELETRDTNHETRMIADAYYRLVRAIFRQPRKTILNNLLSGGFPKKKILTTLAKLKLNSTLRPQNLSLENLIQMSAVLSTDPSE